MANQISIVAGVFEQEAQARRALDALKQAGFDYDQVGVAAPRQQGINLESDLSELGVSRKEASYYAQELKAGRTIVSVRPDGREQEVHNLLHQYGGYDYDHQTLETQTAIIISYARSSYARNASMSPNSPYKPERLAFTRKSFRSRRLSMFPFRMKRYFSNVAL